MEQITNIPQTAPLSDEELAALLAKETFVTTDEVEETDADKVVLN